MDSLTLLDIRSPKWVSLGKNQSVSRAVFLLEALREEFVSLLFSASGSHPGLSSWPCITLTLCGHISFYHPLASLLYRFSRLHWAHLENPGSSLHLKSLNLITSRVPFTAKEHMFTRSGDWDTDIFEKPLFCLPQRKCLKSGGFTIIIQVW